MKSRFLLRETIIPKSQEIVFNFFSKAENLNLITPSYLQFKIIGPDPIIMKKGAIIDYRLKLFGIPFKWRTEITEWEPPFTFTDTQIKGPYIKWVHRHQFKEKEGKTLMIDHVEFLSPGWVAEPIVHHLIVKNNLNTIFDYRTKSIKTLL